MSYILLRALPTLNKVYHFGALAGQGVSNCLNREASARDFALNKVATVVKPFAHVALFFATWLHRFCFLKQLEWECAQFFECGRLSACIVIVTVHDGFQLGMDWLG